MNEFRENPFDEIARQRAVSPEEQARRAAWLAAHPESRQELAEEEALNKWLDALPNAPLSSNFTAQVLAAVAQEQRTADRAKAAAPWWTPLVVRWRRAVPAFAMVLAVVVFVSLQWRQSAEQTAVAHSMVVVSSAAAVPSVDVLKDFDAINRLGQVAPAADLELLTALQ